MGERERESVYKQTDRKTYGEGALKRKMYINNGKWKKKGGKDKKEQAEQ